MEILMVLKNNDQPDKWIIEFNPDMDLFKDPSSDRFVTTFSNSPCWPNYCLRQSFPESYPFENNPKIRNVFELIYPICENNFFWWTNNIISIEKGFKSSGNNIVIRFYDELYQPNAIDKDGIPQNINVMTKLVNRQSIDVSLIKYQ